MMFNLCLANFSGQVLEDLGLSDQDLVDLLLEEYF